MAQQRSERAIIALVGAVQFVNVLDFMMVMPLGPDFAVALGIPTSKLGLIGGSYTFAAAISGLIGSTFLDKFDRRKALFFSMLGLAAGTILGGLANSLYGLMLARIIAGIFGGPATSLSYSIVADVVPPARRGRAMGAVMGAFSISSILGVPAGLELARLGGWRLPFFAVGSLCLVITVLAIMLLPPMRGHMQAAREVLSGHTLKMLKRSEVLFSYLTLALGMFSTFMMVPNFSTFFQHNLRYPREHLGMLYFVGGLGSFFTMRLAGRFIDRYSSFAGACASTVMLILVMYFGYILVPPQMSVIILFVSFMLAMSIRGVSIQSLSSRVPSPNERARFMSFQSAVQHFSAALGAVFSTWILHENADGTLAGMPTLATVCSVLAFFLPLAMRQVEKRVRRKEQQAQVVTEPVA